MPSPQTYMAIASFSLWLVAVCGCTRNPDVDGWTTHSLTQAQEERQDELLNEIRWLISAKDDLAGRPSADYAELLSLADRTKTDGDKKIHAYNVLAGGGGDHKPCEAKIIVSDGKILQAGWPYGEY
ncbi:hypothetical protein Plim_0970 [Planctopirus limnophila DSM 3776]|uniref:Uncharacterized protein n=1 Tax=Planctopirus limnophila (strain ATCC 43296 / DSM 3776 / IFAM 1008 / Mu 290) TaxID=521674 RepID=D5ST46_PLAL2|nr:hypothetical protein [Planctopirus limnophila]ADG66814.1 hypothetical protein Plim_0970 [Planctopirus limnophila DSM 3776]